MLFGLSSGAALAIVVGVLIKAPDNAYACFYMQENLLFVHRMRIKFALLRGKNFNCRKGYWIKI